MKKDSKTAVYIYPPVLERFDDWPISKISKQRRELIDEVVHHTLMLLKKEMSNQGFSWADLLNEATYFEQYRIRTNPWSVDPPDEQRLWKNIQQKLLQIDPAAAGDPENRYEELAYEIIRKYVEQIMGRFDPGTYKRTGFIVTYGFARLLNAGSRKKRIFAQRKVSLHDKIHLLGPIDTIRKLAKTGTLVMVPTHFSNLDSLVMGYAIRAIGLPAFQYGAGLNLFNIKLLAYFMNRLGAYKVDRRRKNKLYLNTLKTYSRTCLKKGSHALFFPGGNRSRNGQLESKLKHGLLNTVIEAQRESIIEIGKEAKKLFVIPVVINYNFTLEAPDLIEEYLEKTGKERFLSESDANSTSFKILKFIFKFFSASSEMAISFGSPMDVFGHPVDEEGNSIGPGGEKVDISRYFMTEGQYVEDAQRDDQYTRLLAEKIVDAFYRHHYILPSYIVAWVAFKIWRSRFKNLDLYEFLRLPVDELKIHSEEFQEKTRPVIEQLIKLEEQEMLILDEKCKGDTALCIQNGIENVGIYHSERPLTRESSGNITTQNLATLFYYHNRLEGYDLEL